jgi:putative ABC transport system substrate-binding protein
MHAATFITVLIALLAAAVHVAPPAGEAQQPANIPRIGLLSPTSLSDLRTPRVLDAFRHGLRESGYVEGQNIAIESRWAEGKYERLRDLAAELVRLKVNVRQPTTRCTGPLTEARRNGPLGTRPLREKIEAFDLLSQVGGSP